MGGFVCGVASECRCARVNVRATLFAVVRVNAGARVNVRAVLFAAVRVNAGARVNVRAIFFAALRVNAGVRVNARAILFAVVRVNVRATVFATVLAVARMDAGARVNARIKVCADVRVNVRAVLVAVVRMTAMSCARMVRLFGLGVSATSNTILRPTLRVVLRLALRKEGCSFGTVSLRRIWERRRSGRVNMAMNVVANVLVKAFDSASNAMAVTVMPAQTPAISAVVMVL